MGWDGLRGGCGLEVCVARAGLNFANAERKQTKNFNPGRTPL